MPTVRSSIPWHRLVSINGFYLPHNCAVELVAFHKIFWLLEIGIWRSFIDFAPLNLFFTYQMQARIPLYHRHLLVTGRILFNTSSELIPFCRFWLAAVTAQAVICETLRDLNVRWFNQSGDRCCEINLALKKFFTVRLLNFLLLIARRL